jgi:Uma2 family endonuclease
MTTASAERPMSPEEALVHDKDHRYELVNGRLMVKPSDAEAGFIALNLLFLIQQFVCAHRLGLVFPPDTIYQIFADDPKRIRKPDGSFIRLGRLTNDAPPRGNIRVAPDLAIESVSPNDTAENVQERIEDLLGAGTRLLWVVYPDSRVVMVYRQDGSVSKLGTENEISGEDVLSDFHCRIEDIFKVL